MKMVRLPFPDKAGRVRPNRTVRPLLFRPVAGEYGRAEKPLAFTV